MNRLFVAASRQSAAGCLLPRTAALCRDAATPGFMAPTHVRILEVSPSHEPYPLIPSFSPSGGEGARRAVEGDSGRFMASIHVRIVEVFPSPFALLVVL